MLWKLLIYSFWPNPLVFLPSFILPLIFFKGIPIFKFLQTIHTIETVAILKFLQSIHTIETIDFIDIFRVDKFFFDN